MAKTLPVVLNVAWRESARRSAPCRHSFSLSLSGSANGDINQCVESHAEAVMCNHAGQRWMAPTLSISLTGELLADCS